MALVRNVFTLITASLLLAGCYESKYALSKAQSPIDKRLVGNWVEQPNNKGAEEHKPCRASIFKFSDNEYAVIFSSDTETATPARAFTSLVDGVAILNLQGIESPDPPNRTYVFFKYGFTPDGKLQTWMLSRDSPLLKDKAFSSQRDFAAYIKKNIHDKRLFDDMRVFTPVDGMDIKLFP